MTSRQDQDFWPHLKSLFEKRRSVRAYLDRPVPNDLIQDILKASLRAPSGGNLQPWNVILLEGAMKRRLSAAVGAAYANKAHDVSDEYDYYPSEWCEPYDGRRRDAAEMLYTSLNIGRRDVAEKRAQQARNYDFFGAPVGLLFTLPRDFSQGSWIDMGIYLGQLQLLLEGAGLGTCLQGSFISYADVIRNILPIPDDQIIICGMAVGYADTAHPINQFQLDRKSLSETVLQFGASTEDIGARILNNGQIFEEKTALKIGSEALSWHEFADQVQKTANHLIVNHQQASLTLSMQNSMGFAIAFMAGQVAGKAVEVLDPAWPESWARDILGDGVTVQNAALPLGPVKVDRPELDLDAAFYTGFTSGSTGRPKGFVRSQRSWLESFEIDTAEFDLSPEDVIAALGNFCHSLPLYALVRGLYEGATTLAYPSFHPRKILEDIEECDVTVIYAVPAQLDALCRAASDGVVFDQVRWILSSGAKCSEALFKDLGRFFPNAELAEFYGSSELSFISVAKKSEGVPDQSVGRPVGPVRIEIHDQAGHPLSVREIGRVFVESPLKFIGYVGSDLTAPVTGGLYTGDVGYLDEAGFLFLTGRADRMINSKGRNIFPETIEAVLEQHPDVQYAAILGAEDVKRGTHMMAIIYERDGDKAISSSDLMAYLRGQVPDYMLPRQIYRAADWPQTASGKSNFPEIYKKWQAGEYEVLP